MRPEAKIIFQKHIRDSDQVLDVGGWHAPFNRADAVIDFMPYESRGTNNAVFPETWSKERFSKKSYVQQDICETPWPFKDKAFDFSICTHTLEDIRDPLSVCKELIRVSKAGYIEVPSRLAESTKGMERPFYCGYYHHRWMCELESSKDHTPRLVFLFKPAMIHTYRQFHFKRPWHKKLNPKYDTVAFQWNDSFDFEERIVIDRNEVQQDLKSFKQEQQHKRDLFVPKYNWKFEKI